MWALGSFCGLLSLQVGCAILAIVFFVPAVLTLGVNVFDYQQDTLDTGPLDLVLVVFFAVLMIVAGVVVFVAAYKENRTLCLTAMVGVVVVTAYWVVLTVLAFQNIPVDVSRVCVHFRCGESFWLFSLSYRAGEEYNDTSAMSHLNSLGGEFKRVNESLALSLKSSRELNSGKKANESENTKSSFKKSSTTQKPRLVGRTKLFHSLLLNSTEEDFVDNEEKEHEKVGTSENNGGGFVFGSSFAGAVIFAIINLCFFIFSLIILWSYAEELRLNEEELPNF